MSFEIFVNNIQNIFHTLDWKHKISNQDRKVSFCVFGYELENFTIEISNKIIITIPFTNGASFKKYFQLDEIFIAMSFLEFHVKNYVHNIMNDSSRYDVIKNINHDNHDYLIVYS